VGDGHDLSRLCGVPERSIIRNHRGSCYDREDHDCGDNNIHRRVCGGSRAILNTKADRTTGIEAAQSRRTDRGNSRLGHFSFGSCGTVDGTNQRRGLERAQLNSGEFRGESNVNRNGIANAAGFDGAIT
jgi:hypothetical protein